MFGGNGEITFVDNALDIDLDGNFYVPEGKTKIGEQAFYDCGNLLCVKHAEDIEVVGSHAFAYCENLETVYFWHNLKEVGEKAFLGCKKLKNFFIPADARLGDKTYGEMSNEEKADYLGVDLESNKELDL